MPAYLIARVEVTDWDRYREYMRHTPRVIAQFGGRFVARGSDVITVEGPPETRRMVVIEFPSLEKAKAFYDSREYRRIMKFREGAAEGQFVIVDGYPDADWQRTRAESEKLSIPD